MTGNLLDQAIERSSSALFAEQQPDGHWVYRARGRCHHPGGICLAAPLSRRTGRCGNGGEDRRLPAPPPVRRASRLAALSRRRLRHQRDDQGLFCAQDDRRCARCSAYGPRPRGGAWRGRGGSRQCFHPHPAGALWRGAMARSADHPARTDPRAAPVSGASQQDFLLGAHCCGALAGAVRAQAARQERQGRTDRRTVQRQAGETLQSGRSCPQGLEAVFQRPRCRAHQSRPACGPARCAGVRSGFARSG